jgi:hypothetical protein
VLVHSVADPVGASILQTTTAPGAAAMTFYWAAQVTRAHRSQAWHSSAQPSYQTVLRL